MIGVSEMIRMKKLLIESIFLQEPDFTGCEKTLQGRLHASGHGFTGCGKTVRRRQEASGFDFSHAATA
jgi:hypothetical protein